MIRILLLSFLLLSSCSNDRSTDNSTQNNNQEQSEQTINEQSNDIESDVEPSDNTRIVEQPPTFLERLFSVIVSFIAWILLLVLGIILTIAIHIKRNDYRNRISKLKWKVSNLSNQLHERDRYLIKLKNRYESLEEHLRKEQKEKKELEEYVSERQSESRREDFDTTKTVTSNINNKRGLSDNQFEDEIIDSKIEVLFFTVPNKYGRFKHKSGIRSFEEKRMYKLSIEKGKSEGVIEFISSKYDEVAINLKDSMIKPACSVIKENENNPISVNPITPGKVKRDGEDWIIEEKIKVEIL